jgi:hypothetical protein
MTRRTIALTTVAVMVLLVGAIRPLFAQNGNTWYVQYFSDPNWSVPSVSMNASYVDFNWGTVAPAPGMPAENWTATMTSSAYFYYSGNYMFQALADDEVMVQVDGVTYINTIGAGLSGKTIQANVSLNAGTHNVVVQFRQYTGDAYVYLNWAYANPGGGYVYNPLPVPMPGATPVAPPPAGPTPTPVPACDPWWSCTCPTQATSVTTAYGNYDQCIQQNLQQAACFVSNGQWDAPNLGSIQTEPQIQVWGSCTPGAKQCMQLACGQAPVEATCSKTGAGWFYYGECSGS